MYKLEKFYAKGFDRQRYREDKFAQEHIAGKSSAEFRKQDFWPLLEKYLSKDRKLLDVGCGIGGWILFLKEEGYDVEGVDIAARTVRALTEYDPDLKVKVASMTAIPYADGSLDGVLAIGTLEYIENKVKEALQEVRRVLKDDGVFFVEVPSLNTLRRLIYVPLKRLEKIIRNFLSHQPTFSNYLFDRGELKKLLEISGFKVLEMQPHELPDPDSHYGLHIDWPFLRGSEPYKLNTLGLLVKKAANAISPWVASTGIVVVARKKMTNE
ncbi:MAG: class I SAM-dependent methyltransferase [bacterium]